MDNLFAPIAAILGKIMDWLFIGLDNIGLGNVAIAIVLFTLIVKLLMLPLSISQQKMSKLQSVIGPEVKAIQEKYKGKTSDPDIATKMQMETRAVYEKYGVSQFGSCVQLLIQFPILLALYQVFRNIPLYISHIKVLFVNILNQITQVEGYTDILNEINGSNVDWTNQDVAITTLNAFSESQWDSLISSFPSCDIIAESYTKITDMNTFLTINMSQEPGFVFALPILIPILAGLTQFISVKVSQSGQTIDEDNPAAASMKMMTLVMPLMSAFIAISVPAGLGMYWIATALIQTIMYICINFYFDKIGTDKIIEKNVEKRNKKRAKKGLPAETISRNATATTKNIKTKQENLREKNEKRTKSLMEMKEANDKKVQELKEEYYKSVEEGKSKKSGSSSKSGSLASKVNLVSEYNKKNEKRK
ncbi:MAG: YidC/Oxa1 family membrane protein insertase [Lachnospira sp.]